LCGELARRLEIVGNAVFGGGFECASKDRSVQLLNLAAQYNFAILEDDYDYDFHYNSTPMLPIASLDRHGHVIYIGTLSKTIAPAVRL
jgi:GntR family transcriptional regulator / MocR family aminotransferase